MSKTSEIPVNFDFTKDYVLENDRVRLIPLSEKHLADLLYYALHEADIWFFSSDKPTDNENMIKYVKAALTMRKEKQGYAFVVWDKQQQRIVGSTRYYRVDVRNKVSAIGYTWYSKSAQGTGVNKNCKYLLFEFLFEKLRFERVEFEADNENHRSKSAILSLGCKQEGILRKNKIRTDGTRRDSAIFGLLREEWLVTAKEQLQAKL
ncbi:GNAT family N-acetyltransferase [Myroides sp. 1354]|uniref:GNAT family N-acetyltransferase n=1 Tax=unclassified Myroides TaxID=2642485 RepID=UPI0025788912|nr:MULTISPECIES: GNAT family protein [unclassified Myroides]MDM1045715.1 GNAT family N-acetyltransferase [Myroides sp. R163-1]MDM1056717.1 GNAT family N-acetyltransferase [Myroides sp. 1354]MDM1070509.1 GNAT family N-acetyltransferase [Myroides sp. 1372]